VIIVQHSNGLRLGGTEKCAHLYCHYLQRLGQEVYYAAPWGDPDVCRLRQFARTAPLFLYPAGYPEALAAFLAAVQPDVFHFHSAGDGGPADGLEFPAKRVENTVFGLYGSRADLKIHPTRTMRERAGGRHYLYNPTEAPYAVPDLRPELGLSPRTTVFGRLSRPDNGQYCPTLPQAFAILRGDVHLLLVSPPPALVAGLEHLGQRARVTVLPPIIDNAHLSRFYHTIDVLAHSRADGETLGQTIQEALRHGKPVVTHRGGYEGHLETLGPGGLVAEAGDWEGYARNMERLLDPAERQRFGEAGREWARSEFDAERQTKKLLELYRHCWEGGLEETGKAWRSEGILM
jgi:glycosyltransferase involved in cell wall biosynthesis